MRHDELTTFILSSKLKSSTEKASSTTNKQTLLEQSDNSFVSIRNFFEL